jgi:RNA polymerase sigma-70 factor (ECF subfamily)
VAQDLRAVFVAAAPPAHAPALRARAGLEQWLRELAARGQAAWPGIVIAEADLAAFAAARLAPDLDTERALAALDPVELYLGCGLVAGQPAALAAFEHTYAPKVRAAVGRFGLDPADVDEITQTVRDRLFVAEPGAAPRIAAYAGRGELGAVVHVIAVRAAVSLLRRQKNTRPLDGDALLRLRASGDVELDAVKAGERAAFKDAFEAAVGELDARDRNLLRLHLLEGVSLDALAGLHRVHRATIVRWLGRARRQVFDATRRRLEAALGLERTEAERLFQLIESRLDLSVERLLARTDADPDGSAPD